MPPLSMRGLGRAAMWSSGRLTSLWNDREVSSSTCAQCGRPLDAHDRHVRFRLPDVVVSAGIELHDESVWMTDPDPDRAVMLRVEGVGRFVRVLLPVQLHDGFSVTFGTWVDVAGDAQFRDIIDVWWSDRYGSYSFTGALSNDLPLWGSCGSAVTARVLDPDQTPYIVASADATLQAVLTRSWPHDELLSALPD